MGSHSAIRFDVTPSGFNYYRELKEAEDEPLEGVAQEVVGYFDSSSFRHRHFEAATKWRKAHDVFLLSESQPQFSIIGHLCREAMIAFAASLVRIYQPPSPPKSDKFVARVRSVLDHEAPRLSKTERQFLDALFGLWEEVNGLVQRQEHEALRGEATQKMLSRLVIPSTRLVIDYPSGPKPASP